MVAKSENKTRIILIRHCEAEGNHKRIFQGHFDGKVSENGRAQLERLAERMKSLPFEAIYSSPLSRALETAKAANRYACLPIQTREGLMEISGGRWEGKPWASFPELYPKESEAWNLHPQDFHPQGGESMREVYDRIWNTITQIVRENQGKTVCVVSHGCAIRNFICRAKGFPIEELKNIDWCDNTGINIIDFDCQMNSELVLESDASHLDENISTFAKQTWWRRENVENMLME